MTVEDRCAAALNSIGLSDHVRIDVYDDTLKAAIELVEAERSAAVGDVRTFASGMANGLRLVGDSSGAAAMARLVDVLKGGPSVGDPTPSKASAEWARIVKLEARIRALEVCANTGHLEGIEAGDFNHCARCGERL
jgi:hypothetical protein